MTKPNVILIVVDTLRVDHMSCYGYGRNTTPHIDKFAEDSLLFENAISASPWTIPSIGCLFTSMHPTVLGYRGKPIKLNEYFLTLAEIFKNNKYSTGGIVSSAFASSRLGFGQGFDFYDEDSAQGHGHISSPSVTEKAISFLEKNKRENFFLFLHYFDPHYDYILHEDYDFYPEYEGSLFSRQPLIREIRKIAPTLSSDDIKYLRALYDSEINFTDEYLGILFAKLKELGLYDDALIIFTSDHGEEFSERGDHWIGHTTKLYQELIHVPLIIKLPGTTSKKNVDENVGLMDLMPTLVDYLGMKTDVKYEFEGEIIDLPDGKRSENADIISQTFNNASLLSLIRDGRKLILNTSDNSSELYSLNEDPEEMANIDEEKREVGETLRTALLDWQKNAVQKRNRFKLEIKNPDFSPEQLEALKSLGYIK
jgi:arylsulfatase A-like enzyme